MSRIASAAPVEHDLAGLEAPVEIRVDRWGVPHIYAQTAGDAFLAQGFNAARERLWQIDLWRRRGLGLLAEALGPDWAERDRAARLFRYRGSMEPEWAAYPAATRLALERFAAGVNAYVELTRARPELLPAEFAQLGYLPARWAPEDVLRVRSNGRHHNVGSEVTRAVVLREFGERVERLRVRLEPDRPLVVPEGLDLSTIDADVLRLYRLATAPFDVEAVDQPLRADVESVWGSNNWALAGARTASGRPILASDPHRALTFPSIRYMAHLSAPGLELIGAGEPAVPGVALGHNGTVAFGVTTFCGDQEDLYVYETDDAGTAYRYDGRWEPFRVEREQLVVRGETPRELELRFTRHGPVVAADPARRLAFAVRAAWLEPGMAPYLGALACLSATTWEQFSAAAEQWGYPGDNLVYADVEGTIAWKPAGRFPVRRGWDGLLPVPGDGRYEWEGHHAPDELPVSVDPPEGWVASANQCNVDPATLERLNLGYEWLPAFRQQRLAQRLAVADGATVRDSVALQADHVSLVALRVVACLADVEPRDPDAAWALATLRGWDGALDADSCAAALFEPWFRLWLAPALLRRALEQLVPAGDVARALDALLPAGTVPLEPRPLLELLEPPAERLGPDGRGALAELVEQTLVAAVGQLERLLGPERAAWSWGRLHRVELIHPAAALLGELDPAHLRAVPAPRGGSIDTVGNTAYGAPDFRQTDGTSWRMVLDVGEWDNSVAVNYPGQSGRLGDRHQLDLGETWAADDAVPLLFSREAVEAATCERILLRPAG